MRKITEANESMHSKKWEKKNFIGSEMLGKTIGIVGFGNIGKKISEISHAYGMNVLVHSASLSDTEQKKYKVEKVSFEEILLNSDIITFHNKLSDKSKYMINKKILRLAKKKPIIINTSRGELVKEKDIIWGLNKKLISGYGTDVIEREFTDIKKSPIIKNLNRYNIIVTPHIGGMTFEGQLRAYNYAVDKFKSN